jgi:carbon storage regulator
MLVLSRKIGEQIVLPESNTSITVLSVNGKRVRLGIQAPSNTTVHRAEVWQRILGEMPPAQQENLPSREPIHGAA